MRNRITQLSRFLLLCAVMFLVTMIPQSVKAITVEEAGEVYMTDSQAGAGQPLYGRLNINYTGNTNYDTWSNDIVTNYNTYDSEKDQYKAAETVLKKADNSVIGKKIKNNRSAKLTKSSGGDGTVRAAYLVWQARTSIKRSTTDAAALAKSEIAFVLPDGSAKLIKAQYATYDNRSIDYINQKKENGVNKQYTFVNMYADVTDIINKSDKIYGTYSVFNIPYYEHIGGGEGAGGWQLIVVENCDITVPMRAVRLRMSATIIVVMSESYADLSVVGNFSTNIDLTPFYDSLEENTIKGHALSSVFGAKTPNSEWEFLTGNSMAFLPSGSVVYQQYITDTPTSLVSNLKNIGYTCVAMHPYYDTGWSRNIVYPNMGFDETHFIDDFDQTKILRDYITDQELYEKIVDRYESKKSNEDLFIMSISMQNHGGYTEKYDNFDEKARMLGINYPDVNQYLSLIHESDSALEYLISYFEKVDDPVEIVFFGDHQPSLSSSFYPYLNGKGLGGLTLSELENLYTVPFFIWTNYDSDKESVELTSLNYLSTLALERAGIALPAYNQFLADMMEEIPAVNSRGFYSKSQGKFLHVEDAAGEDAKWLKNYEILQYNNMFDKRNKSELFFPYLKQ